MNYDAFSIDSRFIRVANGWKAFELILHKIKEKIKSASERFRLEHILTDDKHLSIESFGKSIVRSTKVSKQRQQWGLLRVSIPIGNLALHNFPVIEKWGLHL